MDSSLESIWDEPAIEVSPKRTQVIETASDDEPSATRPSKRPRTSLFFSDSEDDDVNMAGPSREVATHRAPPQQQVDIDALFADINEEDFALEPLPARVDEEALAREAEARHRRNMPASSLRQIPLNSSPPPDGDDSTASNNKSKNKGNDEKKARKTLLKLDENRLLGPNGFPRLIEMTKDFRIKGKGYEATDLNRLLQTYQFWAHQLYPKTQFRDTVERVEKLTHSRRMNVALSVWRDEAHGIPTQNQDAEDNDDLEGQDNADQADDELMDTDDRHPPPRSSSIPSSRVSSPPPTSGAESDAPMRPRTERSQPPAQNGGEGDDDDAFWQSLDDFGDQMPDAHAPPPAPPTSGAAVIDDDEMWDIIDEIEQSASTRPSVTTPAPSAPPSTSAQGQPEPDDWDDMYV